MQKGFTLIETLVAITVLLLVVVGPMTVAQKGIQNAYFATQQATAVFLSQEALEAVREYRDKDALEVFHRTSGNTDTADWASSLNCESGCAYTGSFFTACPLGADSCSGISLVDGQFVHGANGTSPYHRWVTITESGGTAEVDVIVRWKTTIFGGYTTREVRLQSWIYDQYARYEN